jgi:Rieske Fe-S protein
MSMNDDTTDNSERPAVPDAEGSVSRRVVMRGVAIGGLSLPLVAACGGGDEPSSSAPDPAEGSAGAEGGSSSSGGGGGVGTTVPASDVPVDGGAVFRDEKLVVTQPSKGEFKAFSAVCTHQGCVVAEVTDGQIVCNCHGSHFSIEDGAPVSGPAKAPLAAKKVQVNGTRITIT